MEGYRIQYYTDSKTGKKPAKKFIYRLSDKTRAKIFKYIDYLKDSKGYLDEPYSRHIVGSIRELRVDFAKDRHRIFYFTFINRRIILLNGFVKKTQKTPGREINKAIRYHKDVKNNAHLYE